jgi:hypothetical protein
MLAGLGFGLKSALAGAFVAVAGTLVFANGMSRPWSRLPSPRRPAPAPTGSISPVPAEEIGGPQGHLAWYPLADVLFAIALITGLAYSCLAR